MKQFKQFIFKGYSFNTETLITSFFYSFDDQVNFTETIDFRCQGFETISNINSDIIDNLLFHLSIALGISYYKLYPQADIVIENQTLNEDQTIFWKKFYLNGLGEFFYTNQLSPKGLINFINNEKHDTRHSVLGTRYGIRDQNHTALVPIGGGKDSLVTVELIRKIGIPFDTITIGQNHPLHQSVSDQTGIPRLNFIRNLDPQLFEMNKQGYYNGHVPISGIFAFALAFTAYLYNYKYIIMSNEKSANEGNTILNGIPINHQRSKSLEFEKDFGDYLNKYISSDLQYFSLLRGMYEIKIAQLFSILCKKYFPYFSSCNTNFKIVESPKSIRSLKSKTGGPDDFKTLGTGRWCGVCPKCAFVYAILRPFLTDKETIQIFGQELYNNPNLTQTFKELLGLDGIKPFECVGTNEEVILAMYKFYKGPMTNDQGLIANSPILKIFENEILSKMKESDFNALENKLLKIYNDDFIPNYISSNTNLAINL